MSKVAFMNSINSIKNLRVFHKSIKSPIGGIIQRLERGKFHVFFVHQILVFHDIGFISGNTSFSHSVFSQSFFQRFSVRDFLRWSCEKSRSSFYHRSKTHCKRGKKKLAEKMYIVKVINIKIN